MNDQIRLAVIYGSVRPGRFCDTVVRWVLGQCRRRGFAEIDSIDPASKDIGSALAEGRPEELKARIAWAEAFLIVTPEYNHSFPGPLKTLIDSANAEWHAKPVAFVSYGGASGECGPSSIFAASSPNCTRSGFATGSASPTCGSRSDPTAARARKPVT